ncbi:MAG: uracil-DNA glycosylase [Phycisphaerae bacterium]|nr:uracil-DNA glycosylase [Phycisphaerae bacterium]
MPTGGQSSKASARLVLRADRAFGLTAVRVKRKVAAVETISPTRASVNSLSPAREVKSLAVAPPALAPSTVFTTEPFNSSPLSTDEKRLRLAAMDEQEVRGCIKCRLCETRTQTVFGEGDVDAKIFFIGEGPGENEDLSGRPFVGKAGQLLDKMIGAMGLSREKVFIANIVKCRPPNNRVPAPDEVATCTPYLQRQLEIVRPRVIVTLGLPATKYMLQVNSTMGKLRGQWHEWRGIRLMPTFHPAYILRSYTEQTRAAVWSDLKLVMNEIGLKSAKNR